MKWFYALLVLSLSCMVGWTTPLNISTYNQVPGSETWIDKNIKAIAAQAKDLDQKVLKVSLIAYQRALSKGIDLQEKLTIIDYSKPSTVKRLWIIDLKNDKVLFNTYVAHGKNSGGLIPTSFSNKNQSLKSSFGVFVTEDTYNGHNGYSLRIKGLEKGINDNVYDRHVIFHGAKYVSEAYAKVKGMMGRSWGCMAISLNIVKPLINCIKNNTLVVAYYPDQRWLNNSTYVKM